MKVLQKKDTNLRARDDARASDQVEKAVKVSPTSERILQDVTKSRAEALRILADR